MEYIENKRLLEYCKLRNLAQKDIITQLRIKNKSQVSKWWSHEEKFPTSQIIKFLNIFPEINANWFINVTGSMLNTKPYGEAEENHDPSNGEAIVGYSCNNPGCKLQIDALNKIIDAKEELLEMYREKAKKESLTENSAQGGEDTNRSKRG